MKMPCDKERNIKSLSFYIHTTRHALPHTRSLLKPRTSHENTRPKRESRTMNVDVHRFQSADTVLGVAFKSISSDVAE
jgi:hypothetical protein